MSLNTTPRTFVTSEVETAAIFNAELRDAITGIQAAWTAYTPTTTNITMGNGTVTGRSNRMGKTVDFTVTFTFGSTSAMLGAPTFTLPFTALASDWVTSDSVAFDSSAATASAYFPAGAIATSTTVVTWRPFPATAGNPFGGVSASLPFVWATGDKILIAGLYETA